jgi:phage recombination protein Bet
MATVAKSKQGAHTVEWDDIEFLRTTVAQGATDEELKMLLYLSKEYGLDPLKKEIYFIKYGGRSTIITSRDGYLKIANRTESFNGLESDVVYQGDKLTKREDGSLHIEYSEAHLSFDKAKLMGSFCSVFRKDRAKATTVFVSIKDYYKKGAPIWDQYINAMILKVAEAMALKRAFAISGLVTREEIEKEGFELEQETEISEEKMATEAQRKAIFSISHSKNLHEEALKQLLTKHCNKTTTKDLTQEEASHIISLLNSL